MTKSKISLELDPKGAVRLLCTALSLALQGKGYFSRVTSLGTQSWEGHKDTRKGLGTGHRGWTKENPKDRGTFLFGWDFLVWTLGTQEGVMFVMTWPEG